MLLVLFVIGELIAGHYILAVGTLTLAATFLCVRVVNRSLEWQLGDFLLTTQDGLFMWKASVRHLLIWTDSTRIRHNQQIGIAHEDLWIGNLRFPAASGFGGGLFTIETAAEWGRQYYRSRWKWLIEGIDAHRPDLTSICIGMTAYTRMPRLPAASKDAQAVKHIFGESCVCRLDYDLKQFEQTLEEAFEAARGRALMLYFSGHGIAHNGELYLATVDTNDLDPIDTSFPIYRALSLKNEHRVTDLLLILDCCFSGAAGVSLDVSLEKVHTSFELFGDPDYTETTVIASSEPHEPSMATSKQSYFTRALVDAALELRENGIDVKAADLYRAIETKLLQRGDVQRSNLYSSGLGRDLVILSGNASIAASIAVQTSIAARIEREKQTLTKLVTKVERALLNSSQGIWHPADDTTVLIRTKHRSGKSRLGRWAAVTFLIGAALTVEGLRMSNESLRSFIGMTGLFMMIGGFFAFIAAPKPYDPLFLLIANYGLARRTRSACEYYAASEIFAIKSSMTHIQGGAAVPSGDIHKILLVKNNGEECEIASYAESIIGSNDTTWPLSRDDLKRMLRTAVAEYVKRTAQNEDSRSSVS